MIKADVPQDVTEYKEQFFFGMNSRQLICSVLMIVVAVLVFLVGSKFISTDILVYITIALIAPLAAVGFLKYNGMGFEKIAATVSEFTFPISAGEWNIFPRKWRYTILSELFISSSLKKNARLKRKI